MRPGWITGTADAPIPPSEADQEISATAGHGQWKEPLDAGASASTGGVVLRNVTRAARGDAQAGGHGGRHAPPPSAPDAAAPEQRAAKRAPLAPQPTQPSRDRRAQALAARSQSSSASGASIVRATSFLRGGRGVRAATANVSTERNRRIRRNRRFSMTAINLLASNSHQTRRFSRRRRRGRGHPSIATRVSPRATR